VVAEVRAVVQPRLVGACDRPQHVQPGEKRGPGQRGSGAAPGLG
jgi:hypothetical protein